MGLPTGKRRCQPKGDCRDCPASRSDTSHHQMLQASVDDATLRRAEEELDAMSYRTPEGRASSAPGGGPAGRASALKNGGGGRTMLPVQASMAKTTRVGGIHPACAPLASP